MTTTDPTAAVAHVAAENVGGIDETSVTLRAGVTALAGRNATNRTSLLQALMAALGSDRASIKGDADRGHVELEFDGETYEVELVRRNGTVVLEGDPYLDDPAYADRFAFLLEDNPARRAVATGGDLREVVMGPVDTAAIRADVRRLEAEKREVDEELDRLDSLDSRVAELRRREAELDAEIEETEAELESARADLEAADAGVEESRDRKDELESVVEDLGDVRSELDDVRFRLESERESLSALEDEREEVAAELADLPESPAGDLDRVEAEIERVREAKRGVEATINQLDNVVQFNREMLSGDDAGPFDATADDADGDVTDRLVEPETTRCWTCGSEVERDAIEETLDRLSELRREHAERRGDHEAELDRLKERRDELRDQRDRRADLEDRLDRIDAEMERRRETVADLEDRADTLEAEAEALEAEADDLEGGEFAAVLERHREVNQLEFELASLREDREAVREERADIEADLDDREALEARRAEIREELTDLRTRVADLEREAVAAFNDQMATVLEVLDYDNVDRIWLERTGVDDGTDGADADPLAGGEFDLHVVRSADSGAGYEDTVDHLSESEREVTGLVFALAGYLVHDVHESVPFMLLDSLEAVDSDRIAALVDHFRDHVPFLVAALLPEDAAALSDDYHRVTDI